jgi:fluoride exporter
MLSRILLVGVGGFVGSIVRYLAGGAVYGLFRKPVFPAGTLFVNLSGCLIIGFLGGLAESRQLFSAEFRLLIFIGFLGGYTTFSTFSYEVFQLLRDGQLTLALTNAVVHVIAGVFCVWLGMVLSRLV